MENDVIITEEMWRLVQGDSSTTFESSGRRPSWMDAVDRAGLRSELLEVLRMSGDDDAEVPT